MFELLLNNNKKQNIFKGFLCQKANMNNKNTEYEPLTKEDWPVQENWYKRMLVEVANMVLRNYNAKNVNTLEPTPIPYIEQNNNNKKIEHYLFEVDKKGVVDFMIESEKSLIGKLGFRFLGFNNQDKILNSIRSDMNYRINRVLEQDKIVKERKEYLKKNNLKSFHYQR